MELILERSELPPQTTASSLSILKWLDLALAIEEIAPEAFVSLCSNQAGGAKHSNTVDLHAFPDEVQTPKAATLSM